LESNSQPLGRPWDHANVALATELPLDGMEELIGYTDYNFVIAPTYIKYPLYAEFYKRERQRGAYTILDNGAFEGQLVSVSDLLRIIEDLKPDEVVAPDIIGDRDATLDAADKFMHALDPSTIDFKVQFCPQGKCLHEWLECYRELWTIGNSHISLHARKGFVYGISYVTKVNRDDYFHMKALNNFKSMEASESIRMMFFSLIMAYGDVIHSVPHHLLGLGDVKALRFYSQCSFVRSVDTSFPITTAIEGTCLNRQTKKPKVYLDYEAHFTQETIELAKENIKWLREECIR